MNVWDFLLMRDPGTRTVLLGAMLLSIGSAAIGCFALLRKRALVGDAVAHAVLPGVTIAYLIVGTKDPFALIVGAAISGWISMVVMDYIVRNSRLGEDAAIGMTLSVFFGLGILLLTHIQHSGDANQTGLDAFLFGQAASLVKQDVFVFGTTSVLLLGVIILTFRSMTVVSFDRDFSASIGMPVRGIELLMTTLLVLSVVVGIQAVGVVLMAAMLITPAAAARYWTDRLGLMVAFSVLIGVLSGIGGALISYMEPGMPTGPWIVVIASIIFFFSLLFAPGRGVLRRVIIRHRVRRRTLEENILKAFYHLGEKDIHPRVVREIQEIREIRPMPMSQLRRGLARLTAGRYLERSESDGKEGWRLTRDGVRRGARITRLHRLWEVYLTQYLQIAPDHVHDDAETIEHVLTPELEAELESLLKSPDSDPHRRTIPRP